ncbi:MAG: hypothetical protein KC483_10780 [Nitrosarchaeum sp.]|nr:hypothetical protein [Nitrosarchaeum sp.]
MWEIEKKIPAYESCPKNLDFIPYPSFVPVKEEIITKTGIKAIGLYEPDTKTIYFIKGHESVIEHEAVHHFATYVSKLCVEEVLASMLMDKVRLEKDQWRYKKAAGLRSK